MLESVARRVGIFQRSSPRIRSARKFLKPTMPLPTSHTLTSPGVAGARAPIADEVPAHQVRQLTHGVGHAREKLGLAEITLAIASKQEELVK